MKQTDLYALIEITPDGHERVLSFNAGQGSILAIHPLYEKIADYAYILFNHCEPPGHFKDCDLKIIHYKAIESMPYEVK